jgi:hypothetical protein
MGSAMQIAEAVEAEKHEGEQGQQPSDDEASGVMVAEVFEAEMGGRVEDWRRCSVGPAYPLLPVSVGSASLSEP